jgi:hypothetical protein
MNAFKFQTLGRPMLEWEVNIKWILKKWCGRL